MYSLLGALLLSWPAHAQAPPSTPVDGNTQATTRPVWAANPRAVAISGHLPLIFELNRGQTDPQVKFVSRGTGYTLFLAPDEAVLALTKAPGDGTLLRMTLVGARPSPDIKGLEKLPGKVNYFIGNDPAQWRTNIPTYAKVRYESLYPGVDLVYYGNQRQLEYDFVVAPGADPKAITLAFEGPDKLEVDAQGDLVLRTGGGELRLRKPVVYQEVDGARQPLAGNYILKTKNRVGFQVAAYDTTRPLIIDPVLAYSTYLGGSLADQAFAIATDGSGNVWVTGETSSLNTFGTPGAFQTALSGKGGASDAFVTKLNTNVSGALSRVYSTYLGGGAGPDRGLGIAVTVEPSNSNCDEGCAYVTGQAHSSNFPAPRIKSGSLGVSDAFIVKLNDQGSALLYGILLGGNGVDAGSGIALAPNGIAYVTGQTLSSNFPVVNAIQSTLADSTGDAFLAKLDTKQPSSLASVLFSTYLGGPGADRAFGIAVDLADPTIAYLTGQTYSATFLTATPFKIGPPGGLPDAFVAKVNTTTKTLDYLTLVGGSAAEEGRGIGVDIHGNAYVTGRTTSTNFPVFGFADRTGNITAGDASALGDAFVIALNASGSGLLYSTYLGGTGADEAWAIALDPACNAVCNVYVTGKTASSAGLATNALDFSLTGPSDAFVARVNTSVSGAGSLVFFTYLGGSGAEEGRGVAFDAAGNIYVTGMTTSTDFPPGLFTFQLLSGGGTDAFVVKITGLTNFPPTLAPIGNKEIDEEKKLTFTAVGFDPDLQTLTYILADGTTACGEVTSCDVPGGASIDSGTGVFTWTPTETQGPGTYRFKVQVSDGIFSAAEEIKVTVNEVNRAPSLTSPGDKVVDELQTLSFTTLSATDPDVPANTLTFSISSGLQSGMSLNSTTGAFSWTPTEAQGPGTYSVTFRVTDNGTPQLSNEKQITITVNEVNTPPVLSVPGPQTVIEGVLLTFPVSATDADLPANTLTLSAINLPPGATFVQDTANTGTFAWTPNFAQGGPNPYFVQFQVSDGQLIDVKGVSIKVDDDPANPDRDGDGIPDAIDNCPDVPNPSQNDVCNANSPQGRGDLSLNSGITVTLDVTFTAGSDPIFVQFSLSNVICTVINIATGQEVLPGIPEFAPIRFFQDGFTVPANSSQTASITFNLQELGYDLPPGVSLTVSCSYVNFAQPPLPEAGDTKILTGTVTPPPQTAFLGTYDFTLMEPLLSQKVVNQVPVKFTLMSAGAVVSTCTCKLFVQQLDSDGITLIGSPMPATSAGGEVGNVAQFSPTTNQYIFHLSTRNLANGPWQVQVRPDDFSLHTVPINVQH